MTDRTQHATALALFVVALVVAGLAAQQKPEEQPPPRFRTQASYVRVDVYPTADGRPVQDLTKDDFEILEDGVRQPVESFEYVHVRPAGPQSERVEPGSVRTGEQMAANPRNRIFVVFLDLPHVMIESAHAINQPLIRLLDRVLGPDDLVAVMTPSMAVSQLTLGRKTEVLARGLRDNWPWGQKYRLGQMDDWEEHIATCFPSAGGEGAVSSVAKEMINRRRERMTLEALEDLVVYLQTIREERKAIITVTEGWRLYRENRQLAESRSGGDIVGLPPVSVGPGGKLTTKDWNSAANTAQHTCDSERMQLAFIDNDQFFRDLLDKANRANASFYPVDPRGLPASEAPIGPDAPPLIHVDHGVLRQQNTVLRTLAENTDGIAIVNSNDLERGLRRVADDLSSYYLLGYYSTNTRLDGRFREIKVRVKRPGVSVRARRGYRGPTAEDVAAAAAPPATPAAGPTAAVDAAIAALSRSRPETRLLTNASAVAGSSAVWVAGEITSAGAADLARGGPVDIEVSSDGGSGSARLTLAPGERAFLAPVSLRVPAQGELTVRVRISGADRSSASDTIQFDIAPGLVQPLIFRRGASTSNRWRPAADFRFSRTERVRIDVPVPSGARAGIARMLDRSGNPLEVPVAVGERVDETTGQRWLTAEVTLAPLGPGDYAIEVGSGTNEGQQQIITGVRVGR